MVSAPEPIAVETLGPLNMSTRQQEEVGPEEHGLIRGLYWAEFQCNNEERAADIIGGIWSIMSSNPITKTALAHDCLTYTF